jgi:translation initiation factor 3 subunit D
VTTSEDPIIKELAEGGEGNVFATSAVLALLMACPRSVYSWDLLVRKQGDTIFFDKPNYSVVGTCVSVCHVVAFLCWRGR